MQSRRRDFLALLGSTTAFPVAAFAQVGAGAQKLVAVIWGLPENDSRIPGSVDAVVDGLAEQGWNSGQNLRLLTRAGGLDRAVARVNAQELSRLDPDVFIAAGIIVVEEVRAYDPSTPIVFFAVVDPVGAGFAQTLPRPGGLITGFSNVDPSLGGKWLDLLRQVRPGLSHAVLIFNPEPGVNGTPYVQSFQEAATSLGVTARAVPVNDMDEIVAAIDAAAAAPNGGLVASTDAFLLIRRREVVEAAARARIPAIYGYRDYVQEGGLMSYSADPGVWLRGVGSYAGRILNDEQAGELPVQFPSVFQLSINMRTAAALGISIPASLIAIADEILE